jgi:thioredoxin-like negative regulator of GroEL
MDKRQAGELFQKAQQLYKEGQYEQALRLLQQLDKAHPNTPNLLFPRALCLARLGRTDEAHALAQELVNDFGDARAEKLLQELEQQASHEPVDLSDMQALRHVLDMDIPLSAAPPPPPPSRRSSWNIALIGLIAAAVLLVVVVAATRGGDGDEGAGGSASETADDVNRQWFDSYQKGLDAARRRNAPLMLFFYDQESEMSRRVRSELFNTESVERLLRPYVCVRVDVEREPRAAQDRAVRSTPTVILVDEDGQNIDRWTGYVEPSEMYHVLMEEANERDYVRTGSDWLTEWIFASVLGILGSVLALYITLSIIGKLPYGEFTSDIAQVAMVGGGIGLLTSLLSCIGVLISLVIVRKVYEFEFTDYLVWFGIGLLVSIGLSLVYVQIFGFDVIA